MALDLSQLRASFALFTNVIGAALAGKLDKNANATSASTLKDPFDLTVQGDVIGTVSLKGGAPATLQTTISEDFIERLTDLQAGQGWLPKTVSFTATVGSMNMLLADLTATLPVDPVVGTIVEFAKLSGAAPTINTADGKMIVVNGESATSVIYNYNTRLLAVFNGTHWEI